jgi:hypothetical protein
VRFGGKNASDCASKRRHVVDCSRYARWPLRRYSTGVGSDPACVPTQLYRSVFRALCSFEFMRAVSSTHACFPLVFVKHVALCLFSLTSTPSHQLTPAHGRTDSPDATIRITSRRVTSRGVTSPHVTLRHAMFHHVTSHAAALLESGRFYRSTAIDHAPHKSESGLQTGVPFCSRWLWFCASEARCNTANSVQHNSCGQTFVINNANQHTWRSACVGAGTRTRPTCTAMTRSTLMEWAG